MLIEHFLAVNLQGLSALVTELLNVSYQLPQETVRQHAPVCLILQYETIQLEGQTRTFL